MKYSLILILFLLLFVSCKRELSIEEKEKNYKDSINDVYLSLGMNPDSAFSINKYKYDFDSFLNLDDLEVESNLIFEDHNLIFVNDTLILYYYNEFPYDAMCGTEGLKYFEKKMILENFKLKKNHLKIVDNNNLTEFIKNLNFKKEFAPIDSSSLIIAVNKEKLQSKDFQKLRKYLVENNKYFIIRPTTTRERLVSESFVNNTSEDFEKLNWDSIYKVDFKNLYTSEK